MPKFLVGPTFPELLAIGLNGKQVDIATAFYTGNALAKLACTAEHVRLFFRLNITDLTEWAQGYIAPDALHEFAATLAGQGSRIELFVGSKSPFGKSLND